MSWDAAGFFHVSCGAIFLRTTQDHTDRMPGAMAKENKIFLFSQMAAALPFSFILVRIRNLTTETQRAHKLKQFLQRSQGKSNLDKDKWSAGILNGRILNSGIQELRIKEIPKSPNSLIREIHSSLHHSNTPLFQLFSVFPEISLPAGRQVRTP